MTALQAEGVPSATLGRPKRVPRLEGIRGLLAVSVLLYHVSFTAGVLNSPKLGVWGDLISGLDVALPPFFVLSGLLLYRGFARSTLTGAPRPGLRSFFWGRALRILPAYWAMIIIVLLTLNFYSIRSVWYVLNPILLTHFFTITDFNQWITGTEASWTVPAESSFYILLPVFAFLIGVFARRVDDPRRRMRRMLLGIIPVGLIGIGWTTFAYWPSNGARIFYYSFWPFGLYAVVSVGMALATLSAYGEVTGRTPALYRLAARRPNLFWLAALVVFFFNLPIFSFGTPYVPNYAGLGQELVNYVLLVIFAFLLITPLAVPDARSRFLDGLLANPVSRYLGRISYAIYLWQLPFIHIWFRNGSIFGHHPVPVGALTGKVGFWTLFGFVLACSIAMSTVSRYLVELPALRLRGRLGKSRPSQQPVVAAIGDKPDSLAA